MSSPFFSIIVPTFNVADVIAACLASIRRQTCADFEVLIMDGESKDKTVEIVSRLANEFGGRMFVHCKKDTGVYDAMNQGISLAKGEWLYFLGADDRLHETDVLEKVAAGIQTRPDAGLVYGDVILRSDSSRYAGVFDLKRILHEKNICHQAIFYRRTVFNKIGGYNLQYRIWADWDLNIRCFQHPDLAHSHLDLVVADYNDRSGVSRVEDPEFRKLLPVFTKRDRRFGRVLRRKIASWFWAMTGG